MPELEINEEFLRWVMKLPKKKRREYMQLAGKHEWQKCADDIFYWIDAKRHYFPYVYTLDPHPMSQCLLCKDAEGHAFSKRTIHLELAHELKVEDEDALRGYFLELPTTRIFTVHDYMRPIIKYWQQEQYLFVEKSRDMMMTWLAVTMYTWDTLFHSGRQNIFQSEDAMKTLELVKRAGFIYNNQPKFLRDVHKVHCVAGAGKAGVFIVEGLNSEILGFPQGPDQIRQYHPSGVFQDEAAFQDKAGESFSAIKPSIQNGGRFTAVSSANPSWFYLAVKDRDQ